MTQFSKATMPSYVTPPVNGKFATIFEFLISRFSQIPKTTWLERIESGKVHFDNGELITQSTPYQERRRISYYREVVHETLIPFKEKILFENDNFLIVDKPHFLPIHPAGRFVNETLISRLSAQIPAYDIIAAHRLDRLTAGLILCVKRKEVRAAYQQLFMNGVITKEYLAVGTKPKSTEAKWHIKANMQPYNQHFRMQIVPGTPNSESYIELIDSNNQHALFKMSPITGKKHQLRVHLASIGSGILNDPLYPNYSEIEKADNFNAPMQLLAHKLNFVDPITNEEMEFTSQLTLDSLLTIKQ